MPHTLPLVHAFCQCSSQAYDPFKQVEAVKDLCARQYLDVSEATSVLPHPCCAHVKQNQRPKQLSTNLENSMPPVRSWHPHPSVGCLHIHKSQAVSGLPRACLAAWYVYCHLRPTFPHLQLIFTHLRSICPHLRQGSSIKAGIRPCQSAYPWDNEQTLFHPFSLVGCQGCC